MSYKPLSDAEHEDGDINGPSLYQHEPKHDPYQPQPRPARRLFKTSRALHMAISIAAGTVMMLFGYEQGVFGGIIVGDDFLEYFHNPSPAMQGFVTSVYDLGCFGGAVIALFVGEKLGRKRMLIVFTIIMGSGIIVQTACHNMTVMVWGRLIAGIGNGGNTATAPVWHVSIPSICMNCPLSDTDPARCRSRLLTSQQRVWRSCRKWPSTFLVSMNAGAITDTHDG